MPPSGKSPVEVSRMLLWLWAAAGFGFSSEEKGFIGGASGSSMYTSEVGHSSIFLSKSPCSWKATHGTQPSLMQLLFSVDMSHVLTASQALCTEDEDCPLPSCLQRPLAAQTMQGQKYSYPPKIGSSSIQDNSYSQHGSNRRSLPGRAGGHLEQLTPNHWFSKHILQFKSQGLYGSESGGKKGTVSQKGFTNFTTVRLSFSSTEKMQRVGAGMRRLDSKAHS